MEQIKTILAFWNQPVGVAQSSTLQGEKSAHRWGLGTYVSNGSKKRRERTKRKQKQLLISWAVSFLGKVSSCVSFTVSNSACPGPGIPGVHLNLHAPGSAEQCDSSFPANMAKSHVVLQFLRSTDSTVWEGRPSNVLVGPPERQRCLQERQDSARLWVSAQGILAGAFHSSGCSTWRICFSFMRNLLPNTESN